jgi:hypothetical protein
LGACTNLFPLVHYNAKAQIMVIVLCSSGASAWAILDNALGAFGEDQLSRLEQVLREIPTESRTVLVMLHHPTIRRISDKWRLPVPDKLLNLSPWLNSDFIGYLTLYHAPDESIRLIQRLLDSAEAQHDKSFVLLFGHVHQRFLGRLCRARTKCMGRNVLISEAPALFNGQAGGRVGLVSSDSASVKLEWLSH